MYVLHIANKNYSSWSLRPWALMRELAIPFEERLYSFETNQREHTFQKFSPTGQVPCLHDGETVVWNSLGIVEYLAERHEGVWPRDARARAWARCAAAEMHAGFSTLRTICTMNCGLRVRLESTPPALLRDVARLGALWNEGLARFGGPFLAGATFSGVDAFFTPVAFRAQTYGLALDANSAAYVARLLALPSIRSWETAALAETWRDEPHEAEVLEAGTVTADLRAKSAQ